MVGKFRAEPTSVGHLIVQPRNRGTAVGILYAVLHIARDPAGSHRVHRFIEKPSLADARLLIECGALWNMFIMVAAAQRLIDLFRPTWGALLTQMQALVCNDEPSRSYRATFEPVER